MGTSILQTVLSVLKMYQTLLYFILQICTFVMQTLCSVPFKLVFVYGGFAVVILFLY